MPSFKSDDDLQSRLRRALGDAYEVRGLLGRGGFAAVYSAIEVGLKRDVAVKVLRPELAVDPAMRQRFRREAEAVARLRHPHIVPIYSVGEDKGLAWYVMPLIVGPSLKQHLEKIGRLPIADARRMLLEAADGLAVAHRAGIVHRDIKPDNLLLDGADARVLLTDFGIAKALGGTAQTLTETGVVIGTPQYMSPEQAGGEATDARSDVYSLGVVAYQLLTGELPFEAGTVAALLVKQLVAEAPSVLRKRPDCPTDLAVAVMRCLAKAPQDRWATAEALQDALALPRETGSLVRPRPRGGAAAGTPLERFRRLVLSAIGVVVVLIVVDAVRGQILFAPLGVLVAAFVVATAYGPLWTAGYGWREIISRGGLPAILPIRSPVPLDSDEFGPHAAAIQQARTDRAALRAALERLPRTQRRSLAAAVQAADALVARAATTAVDLQGLDRQIDPGPEEIDRRLAATAAEPPSPGRAQRLAVLQRRRSTIDGLLTRRDRVSDTLTNTLTALARLRGAADGTPADIEAAIRDANLHSVADG